MFISVQNSTNKEEFSAYVDYWVIYPSQPLAG